ncbi:MAG: arsenate reductase family protein [Sphaerochaeta sp.]
MTIICYPSCSTCRKAVAYLEKHKVAYTYRDIKQERPTKEELQAFYRMSGLPLKRFFNTSGQLYRSYDLKNRLPGMTEEEMFTLLSSDGMLVKRPLLVLDDVVLVGFREEVWNDHLGGTRG